MLLDFFAPPTTARGSNQRVVPAGGYWGLGYSPTKYGQASSGRYAKMRSSQFHMNSEISASGRSS